MLTVVSVNNKQLEINQTAGAGSAFHLSVTKMRYIMLHIAESGFSQSDCLINLTVQLAHLSCI